MKKTSLQWVLVVPFLRLIFLPHQINQTNAAVLQKGLIDAADQKILAAFEMDARSFQSHYCFQYVDI